jgi:fructose-bisphosphate aldolase class II
MSRTHAKKLVLAAQNSKTAIGAFNVILLEHAEALVAGAETANLPVILQISENCVTYHRSLKPISVATIAIAETSSVPVSVHLDHAESEELIKEALDLGFDSIMFDGSKLPFAENVATSARIADLCKSYGATLEVEIGEVGGKYGVHAPGIRTKPLEAKSFAEATGADLLAVAVGSSHAMTTRDATLDFELIAEIAESVSVPLVLHGSSGVNDRDLQKAASAGMSKINIATHLNHVFTDEIRKTLHTNPDLVDPRKYISPGRTAVTLETTRLLRILNLSE